MTTGSMPSERWQRVKKLVDEALDLELDERAAFLDHSCSGDQGLRREVATLVEREARLGGFLARPFFTLRAADEDADEGRRLGPYRLVRRLGSGGMGTVYLADREDGELRQQVAIKVLKRGLDSGVILRRFKRERQILADLVHPYIARLLDAGTAEDGRPFLVMEYVEGEPIDAYCDRRGLDTRQRVALFRRVCLAVQFAHRNLVVHRDLKPANILVAADGTPKLLDFGIAKLLGRESRPPGGATANADSSPADTAHGTSPLTSLYASPEQVAGGTITTATDVYALGVVLYQLLTGHHPCGDRTKPWRRDLAPARPSQVVLRRIERHRADRRQVDGGVADPAPESVSRTRDGDPRRLARRLAGDLDTIVLKALEAAQEHRFQSAEQLSEDLRRHLEGLPVRSRPHDVLYRAGKFVRRHALGVQAAAVIALLVLGFGVVMAAQSRTISHQKTALERERDRAEEVTTFLENFLRSPDRGATLTVREALDSGVKLLRRRRGDDPDIRAELLDTVGGVYRNLGLDDRARPLLEEALELRRQLYGEDHLLVAETLHNLALLELFKAPDEAERLMRRALEIQRRELTGGHRDLARGVNNLAMLLRRKDAFEEAEALAREALAMKQALFGAEHPEVTAPLNTLATVLRERGELEQSEAVYRECLRLRRLHEDPMSQRLSNVLSGLAEVLVERGEPAAALPFYREALGMRRQLYDGDDRRLVGTLNHLGRAHILLGEPAAAEPLLDEALQMERRLVGDGTWTVRVALLAKNLAWARLEAGDFTGCESLTRPALDSSAQLRRTWRVAEVQSVLGGCLTGQGRLEEAEALLLEGYRRLEQAEPSYETVEARAARQRLVALYETWGRPRHAARFRRQLPS